ncbi:MAG: CHASE2 domain-containing protein [Candidatus Obscuribacterales bacterium]|nr:CHASE2 domain-containing protein [Candidatus Obscuribacterales bacterium]
MFFAVASIIGCLLELSAIFERQERQTINGRFEAKEWLSSSISHSNWWPLSTKLFEKKSVVNKIVIFNRDYEDEPPAEAVERAAWLKPLMKYPISSQTTAEIIEFLAKAGAKLIIIDDNFRQDSFGSKELAETINRCGNGAYGKAVPVLINHTFNPSRPENYSARSGQSNFGLLAQLSQLEPEVNIQEKYIGTTSLDLDHDQLVRSIRTRFSNDSSDATRGRIPEALIIKALKYLDVPMPADLPEKLEIDFSAAPKTEYYPTRSLSYLLNPEQQKNLLQPTAQSDLSLKDAVVLIGDGVDDVYNTPFTNEIHTQRSKTDILAHAMETIARHSWPKRLTGNQTYLYILLSAAFGAIVWVGWKVFQQTGNQSEQSKYQSLGRLIADISFSCLMLSLTDLAAGIIFAGTGLLVPVFIPTVSLGLGTLAAIIWEREREKENYFQFVLAAAQEKLDLERDKFSSELARQEAEGKAREMMHDRQRRHEFMRRINHDLNAPVTVLNWTLSELNMMKHESSQVQDKISRLVKASDKLCELIDQLVQSYNYDGSPSGSQASICDLAKVIDDCVDGQKPLAQKYEDTIEWTKPNSLFLVKASPLELSRVIDNIIGNAIKHNPQKTKIFISQESHGAFHHTIISDTGTGIPAEYLEQIFQPGFRINPNTEDGGGLGLDIAKTLILSMGGEISVASILGKGTRFQIMLPICSTSKNSQETLESEKKMQIKTRILPQ